MVEQRRVQGRADSDARAFVARSPPSRGTTPVSDPGASLFNELKLEGAKSTTPRGGRGRIARSREDFDDLYAADIGAVPRSDDARGVWCWNGDNRCETKLDQCPEQLWTRAAVEVPLRTR